MVSANGSYFMCRLLLITMTWLIRILPQIPRRQPVRVVARAIEALEEKIYRACD